MKYPNLSTTGGPETWKYYLNISGEYHIDNTPMTVRSHDTLDVISFDKNTLLTHPVTVEAFQVGTPYYNDLVRSYPDQDNLILGILYPVDIQTAINAPDYSILGWKKDLIEEHEVTLIPELQEWLTRHQERWHVRAFSSSDSLYPVAQHAIMYLNLVPKILNLRLKRCGTIEAHTFHITEFLASHNGLDKFIQYMTLKQKLFLYRNIRLIERNAGKTVMFKWLVEKMLTDRLIPLVDYSARLRASYNDKYLPDYVFKKRPLNRQYNIPEKIYYSLDELLTKEEATAPGNKQERLDNEVNIDNKFKFSPSSVVQTKDLESSMIDYSDAVPLPFVELLVSHFVFMAGTGLYTAVVNFRDPTSGKDYSMPAQDAAMLMHCLMLVASGVTPVTIPDIFVDRVSRTLKPSVSELSEISDPLVVTDTLAQNWLINNQPPSSPIHSSPLFYTYCSKLFQNGLSQWFLTSRTEDLYERGYVDNMVNRMYFDTIVTFPDSGMNFQEWLSSRNIEITGYSSTACIKLMNAAFYGGTGLSSEFIGMAEKIQRAMLNVMRQLSSYSVQFIQNINTSNIIPLDKPDMRFGKIQISSNYGYYFPVGIRIEDFRTTEVDKAILDTSLVETNVLKDIETVPAIRVELNPEVTTIIRESISVTNLLARVNLTTDEDLTFQTNYLTLSDAEKLSLVDIYSTPREMPLAGDLSLSTAYRDPSLPPVTYTGGEYFLNMKD